MAQPSRNWDEEDFFCTKCSARREPERINRDAITAKIDAYRLAKGLAPAEVKAESDTKPDTDPHMVPQPAASIGTALSNGVGPTEQPAADRKQPRTQQIEAQWSPLQQSVLSPQLPSLAKSVPGEGSSTPANALNSLPSDGSSASANASISGSAGVTAMSANGSASSHRPAQSQPARTQDNTMGPPTGQLRNTPASSIAPIRPGASTIAPLTSQSPGQPAAPPSRLSSFGPDDKVTTVSPGNGLRDVSQAAQSASPPQSPVQTPASPLPLSDAQAPSPVTLASPKLQTSGNGNSNNSNGAARNSKNAGAAGSFPIRRPNSSVARSPLSGPSISPGGNGGPPPMSLGEALTGSGTIGSGSMRGISPSPGAGSGRSLGPLPRFNSGASDGTTVSSTSIPSSAQGSESTNATNGSLHKNVVASYPHAVSPSSSLATGPTPSPIVRPPPPGALMTAPGAVSPTPSPAEGKSGVSKGEGGERSTGPGPRQGSLAEGKVSSAADLNGSQSVNR